MKHLVQQNTDVSKLLLLLLTGRKETISNKRITEFLQTIYTLHKCCRASVALFSHFQYTHHLNNNNVLRTTLGKLMNKLRYHHCSFEKGLMIIG